MHLKHSFSYLFWDICLKSTGYEKFVTFKTKINDKGLGTDWFFCCCNGCLSPGVQIFLVSLSSYQNTRCILSPPSCHEVPPLHVAVLQALCYDRGIQISFCVNYFDSMAPCWKCRTHILKIIDVNTKANTWLEYG